MNLVRTDGDLNENGTVGIEDFREWKNAFGGSGAQVAAALRLLNGDAVPEPGTALLALLAGCCVVAVRRMSSRGIDNRS
jgi:hypothetical protein